VPAALLSVLSGIAAGRQGHLRVVGVDWDGNCGMADRLALMAVPTLFLFAGGAPIRRITGYTTKFRVLRMVNEALAETVPAA
jgi:thioredoxin 1